MRHVLVHSSRQPNINLEENVKILSFTANNRNELCVKRNQYVAISSCLVWMHPSSDVLYP